MLDSKLGLVRPGATLSPGSMVRLDDEGRVAEARPGEAGAMPLPRDFVVAGASLVVPRWWRALMLATARASR